MPTARKLLMPPADLLEDIIGRPDPSVDPRGTPIIRLKPRHERLYVAGWMLHDGTIGDYKRAMQEAFELYEGSGTGLLDKPRELTTADIVAEVFCLLEGSEDR